MKRVFHYCLLVAVILLGVGLRFSHLELKAFWQDEIITALFSLGRSYQDLPLDQVVPVSRLLEILTPKIGVSCPDIAQALVRESTHPPLFFCLASQWLQLPLWQDLSLVWVLRGFAAIWGMAAIGAVYGLTRSVFSPGVGLLGAALMAVSPFAVYLSQEARHYSFPLFLVCLALWALVEVFRDVEGGGSLRWLVLLGWMGANLAGFYTHYFFLLVFLAQLFALITLGVWRCPWGRIWPLVGTILLTVGLGVPGLQIFLSYGSRPETDWLQLTNGLAPVYQVLLGWIIFVIALPVEKQPILIKVISLTLTLGLVVFWVRLVFPGTRRLWRSTQGKLHQQYSQRVTRLLVSFLGGIFLQFAGIIYILGKDLTLAPRYNYVYYPAVVVLLAGSVWMLKKYSKFLAILSLLVLGFISAIFVSTDLTFKKPFHPQKIIGDILPQDAAPLVVVVGYNDFQDIALGLSLVWELGNYSERISASYLTFLQRDLQQQDHPILGYKPVWKAISELSEVPAPPFHLWVVAPGLKAPEFPSQLQVSQGNSRTQCQLQTTPEQNVGVVYQHYPCLTISR